MKRVLAIAGSDSGGGAGIHADLKTLAALGVYGATALTAVTAQNTLGVQGVFELPPDFVGLQIDSVLSDIGADAVKTGMVANAETIEVIADRLQHWAMKNVVVDPVMVATSGDLLLRPDAREALVDRLLPLARIITPNLHEARALSGLEIRSLGEMREAALAIYKLGPRGVVVKGGHFREASDSVDVLFDGRQFQEFASPWVESPNTHGTGCTLASAIAAGLAKGLDLSDAVRRAKDYLSGALASAAQWHLGRGHGPVDHFWRA